MKLVFFNQLLKLFFGEQLLPSLLLYYKLNSVKILKTLIYKNIENYKNKNNTINTIKLYANYVVINYINI